MSEANEKIYRVVGYEEHKNARYVTNNLTLKETHEYVSLYRAKYGNAWIEVLKNGCWREYRGF